MKSLRCTYRELLELPAIIYEDAVADINASGAAAKSEARWAKR